MLESSCRSLGGMAEMESEEQGPVSWRPAESLAGGSGGGGGWRTSGVGPGGAGAPQGELC